MYVLMIVILGLHPYSGVAVSSAEFNNESACRSAAKAMREAAYNGRVSANFVDCFPKGDKPKE